MGIKSPPLAWRMIRWILMALAVPGASQGALAEAPRLGPFEYPQPSRLKTPDGTEAFDPFQALNGSYASAEACRDDADQLWIEVEGAGDCIRYYQRGLAAGPNPVVLVYFGGDVMLRTSKGVRFISQSYAKQSPATIEADLAQWSQQAGVPTVFVARPGIYGSSGDHNLRRHRREVELMDRAIELIKNRHAVSSFVVAGHSAGGQIAASLLNWRTDIAGAAISSGMVSVKQVANFWEKRRTIPGRLLYDSRAFYDPVTGIETIRKEPAPAIYVISDPEDRVVPFFSQLYYVRKLRGAGFTPQHIYAHAPDVQRHLLADHAKRTAAMIARGATSSDIRRALTEIDLGHMDGAAP